MSNTIETIRAEVERRIKENEALYPKDRGGYWDDDESCAYDQNKAYTDLLAILDTLQEQPVEKTTYDTQNYTPSSSVSVEDVARVQFGVHAKIIDKKRKAVFDWEQFKKVASIFYSFGKNDSSETKENEQPASEELEKEPTYTKKQVDEMRKKVYQSGYNDGYQHGKEDEQKEQKPAEWSEEDEKRYELALDCIHKFYPEPLMKYKLTDWFKSLHHRQMWAPNEEQIEYLAKAIKTLGEEGDGKTAAVLNELRCDLKKLLK